MRTLIAAGVLAATVGLVQPGTARAESGWQVTVHPSAMTLTLGQSVVLKGRVRPGGEAVGARVQLQQKLNDGKPWSVRDTDTVSPTGRYQISVKPTSNLATRYRVVLPAARSHGAGVSRVIRLDVYAWTDLTKFRAANGNGIYKWRDIEMDGVDFAHSLAQYYYARTGHIEFNLDHLCTALRGTFGISDSSEIGGVAQVTAIADDDQLYTHAFSVGQHQFKQLPLDTPLKLRFETWSQNPAAHGNGAVGTPQVLCTTR